MNIFRRKARRKAKESKSLDIPKLSLPRQKESFIGSAPGLTSDSSSASPDWGEGVYGDSSCGASSLSVPNQHRLRSSSFDTSTLHHEEETLAAENYLQVPGAGQSVDYGDTSEEANSDKENQYLSFLLGLPKYYRRRSLEIPKLCIHCVHLESLSSGEASPASVGSFDYEDDTSRENRVVNSAYMTGSISDSNSDDWEEESDDDEDLEYNLLKSSKGILLTVTPSGSEEAIPVDPSLAEIIDENEGVITLKVPIFKPRSSSMDAAYLQPGSCDERRCSMDPDYLNVPQQARSSSVDVNLPTKESPRYSAIASPTSSK